LAEPTRQRMSNGAARRVPYDADSLLDVAVRVFNERGYDGTSMEDLARAAGISKSSFYHHVSGKEALLAAACDRALFALTAIQEDPLHPSRSSPVVGKTDAPRHDAPDWSG